MKTLLCVLTLLLVSPAHAADPASMSDTDMQAAFKLCFDAQNAGGGTLAGNPQMAALCQPVITEADKRRKANATKVQQPSIDQLQKLLNK